MIVDDVFTLLIGAALFIAGKRHVLALGESLTFGAVSSFTIPIIVMASSLEFGKLIGLLPLSSMEDLQQDAEDPSLEGCSSDWHYLGRYLRLPFTGFRADP